MKYVFLILLPFQFLFAQLDSVSINIGGYSLRAEQIFNMEYVTLTFQKDTFYYAHSPAQEIIAKNYKPVNKLEFQRVLISMLQKISHSNKKTRNKFKHFATKYKHFMLSLSGTTWHYK